MRVLVSEKTNRKYYVKNIEQDYHCKEGIISIDDLNSKESIITSTKGVEFQKFNAHRCDTLQKMKRTAQVILPKDLGYIAARVGMSKEDIILEAGSGSGFATTFFSGICKKVLTFERIEDHFECSKKNIEEFGFSNVELYNQDIIDFLEQANLDKKPTIFFLDLPEPVSVLKKLNSSHIQNGGHIVCYLPSTRQVDELVEYCSEHKDTFLVDEVSESQIRNWRVNSRTNRPEHHKECDFTAFLVFLRYIK
ncbi:MAG: methyltransferase domain-containing protein [Candidatus Nanoarchaeia archaeon]